MKKRLAIALTFYILVAILLFLAINYILNNYPLLGFILGVFAAAGLTYFLSEDILDFLPEIPKYLKTPMLFILLTLLWPISLALSVTLVMLYVSLRLIATKRIIIEDSHSHGSFGFKCSEKRKPTEFLEELRRRLNFED